MAINYVMPDKINQTGGLEWPIYYIGMNIPQFPSRILMFIWLAIIGVGFFSQRRSTGRGSFFMWATIGGLISTTGAFILFLLPKETPLISLQTLVLFVAATILFAILFWIGEAFTGDD